MEDFGVTSGDVVLVLWGGEISADPLQNLVTHTRSLVGSGGKVQVENNDRLNQSGHSSSSFTKILSGVVEPYGVTHQEDLLSELLRILRPSGRLILKQKVSEISESSLESKLKLTGFVDTIIVAKDDSLGVLSVQTQKPSFEVGSSTPLSFAQTKPADDIKSVWTLGSGDMVDDDLDLINSDDLLDEEDLKKPDASTLRVCGTTGKRKACKNCSCGLAEELDGEIKSNKPPAAKSSCGSCYLGDAFRCASCPYMGMPAFKPGEKIQLPNNLLQPDL